MEKAPACEGCMKWDMFKDSCWVYWKNKKICSQHATTKDQITQLPNNPL